MSTLELKDYVERDVTEPRNGLTVMANSWWLCVDGDPKRALFYKGSFPQCNTNKYIVERLNKLEGVIPTYIPTAYVRSRD